MYGYDDNIIERSTKHRGAATSQMYGYDDNANASPYRHSQLYGYDNIIGL